MDSLSVVLDASIVHAMADRCDCYSVPDNNYPGWDEGQYDYEGKFSGTTFRHPSNGTNDVPTASAIPILG